jgi:hypothetical protein
MSLLFICYIFYGFPFFLNFVYLFLTFLFYSTLSLFYVVISVFFILPVFLLFLPQFLRLSSVIYLLYISFLPFSSFAFLLLPLDISVYQDPKFYNFHPSLKRAKDEKFTECIFVSTNTPVSVTNYGRVHSGYNHGY